jgi:ribosomal protein S18 acetylase RimI-like enzyme
LDGIVSLEGPNRERAVPVLIDAFTGIYRWHAKRTLREATWVRAWERPGEVLGVAMLERLTPEVGYVYYVAVRSDFRRRKIGAKLLDDALAWLALHGVRIVYAVVTEGNRPSESLFRSRGFRPIDRDEKGYAEGGLGAWGLRSRMRIVRGEFLMGRRLADPADGSPRPS